MGVKDTDLQKPVKNGVYAMYIKKLEKYGAYQVLYADGKAKSICYVALDYLEDTPPDREKLCQLMPLYMESHRYHHSMRMAYIQNNRVPKDFIFCGICPPIADCRKCNCFSGDWNPGWEYINEARWKSYGADAISRYKKAMNSGDAVYAGNMRIPVRMTGLHSAQLIALGEKVSLSDFPCLSCLEVPWDYPYLERLLAQTKDAPIIRELDIVQSESSEARTQYDLRGTHFTELQIDATGLECLKLPETITVLRLTGSVSDSLQIDDTLCRQGITLAVSMRRAALHNYGMTKVESLILREVGDISMEKLVCMFPDITALTLFGNPGVIEEFEDIAWLAGLTGITLCDMFGYGAEEFAAVEKLTGLQRLSLESIPKEAGQFAKKIFQKKLDTLEVVKLRNEQWLAENLDNPLRHWDGSEFIPKAAYKAAFQQYKTTSKLFHSARTRDELYAAVRSYGEEFNRLNERYEEFIETEEREDIFAALEKIYQSCITPQSELERSVSSGEVLDWLDGIRTDW